MAQDDSGEHGPGRGPGGSKVGSEWVSGSRGGNLKWREVGIRADGENVAAHGEKVLSFTFCDDLELF